MSIQLTPKQQRALDHELHSGDRMTQREFHRIYERMPEGVRAELIGGIVYVSSPLKIQHGTNHFPLGTVLFVYEGSTPGVESADNTTVILGSESELQPDCYLRILPTYGGRSRSKRNYVVGAPEFIGEIAYTSRSIDLHAKKKDYARYGVLEYLVVCVIERQLRWFDLRADEELVADDDGVLRIRCFPGLWIDADALLARDARRLLANLEKGLATPEHAAFVRQLAARKAKRRRK
jgi:Uma2 family endonuclease